MGAGAEMPSLFMEVQCFWSAGTEFCTGGSNFVCPGAFGCHNAGMNELTPEQIDALEDMIARRMANTGETRREACTHIARFFEKRLAQIRLDSRPVAE